MSKFGFFRIFRERVCDASSDRPDRPRRVSFQMGYHHFHRLGLVLGFIGYAFNNLPTEFATLLGLTYISRRLCRSISYVLLSVLRL